MLRYIMRSGAPGMSWACRVVEDSGDRVALFIPQGATYMRWSSPADGPRHLEPGPWRRDMLRFMFPGELFSIWLFWERGDGEARHFTGYYINMEEPFRRTEIGFDTNDHALDVVVAPDLSWRWKDAEEFDDRVRNGIYSPEFGDSVWAAAKDALARLERREPPFDHSWDAWTPAPWDAPEMPENWHSVPAIPWPQRHWAYLDTR